MNLKLNCFFFDLIETLHNISSKKSNKFILILNNFIVEN